MKMIYNQIREEREEDDKLICLESPLLDMLKKDNISEGSTIPQWFADELIPCTEEEWDRLVTMTIQMAIRDGYIK